MFHHGRGARQEEATMTAGTGSSERTFTTTSVDREGKLKICKALTSKLTPMDVPLPAKLHHLKLPKQRHHLETKCSNTQDMKRSSYSNLTSSGSLALIWSCCCVSLQHHAGAFHLPPEFLSDPTFLYLDLLLILVVLLISTVLSKEGVEG